MHASTRHTTLLIAGLLLSLAGCQRPTLSVEWHRDGTCRLEWHLDGDTVRDFGSSSVISGPNEPVCHPGDAIAPTVGVRAVVPSTDSSTSVQLRVGDPEPGEGMIWTRWQAPDMFAYVSYAGEASFSFQELDGVQIPVGSAEARMRLVWAGP